MSEQNLELHYAKNIAKQRKLQRNIFIGISLGLAILLIIAATALGLACKDGRQKLSFYLKPDHTAVWGGATIWEHKDNYDKNIFFLYFSNNKASEEDIKWDGIYPSGYFDN